MSGMIAYKVFIDGLEGCSVHTESSPHNPQSCSSHHKLLSAALTALLSPGAGLAWVQEQHCCPQSLSNTTADRRAIGGANMQHAETHLVQKPCRGFASLHEDQHSYSVASSRDSHALMPL